MIHIHSLHMKALGVSLIQTRQIIRSGILVGVWTKIYFLLDIIWRMDQNFFQGWLNYQGLELAEIGEWILVGVPSPFPLVVLRCSNKFYFWQLVHSSISFIPPNPFCFANKPFNQKFSTKDQYGC